MIGSQKFTMFDLTPSRDVTHKSFLNKTSLVYCVRWLVSNSSSELKTKRKHSAERFVVNIY